jgi:hypothetical protein
VANNARPQQPQRSFSERHGYKPIRSVFQVNSIDEPLRNALLSALNFYVLPVILNPHNYAYTYNYSPSDTPELIVERFLTSIWFDHYKLRFKSRPDDFADGINL